MLALSAGLGARAGEQSGRWRSTAPVLDRCHAQLRCKSQTRCASPQCPLSDCGAVRCASPPTIQNTIFPSPLMCDNWPEGCTGDCRPRVTAIAALPTQCTATMLAPPSTTTTMMRQFPTATSHRLTWTCLPICKRTALSAQLRLSRHRHDPTCSAGCPQ